MISRLGSLFLIACALPVSSGAGEFRKLEPMPTPVLEAVDINGSKQDLASYKGRIVLVNFWASWCPPCRKEIPSMQRLTQKLVGKPFAILAVDSGETGEEAETFLKGRQLQFSILLDSEGEIAKRWKVFVMPTSFLVDKKGRVRYVFPGGTEWDQGDGWRLIREMLDE